MTDLRVVPLRETPLLNNIPAMMREVADQIERGEIEATYALMLIPVDGDWPQAFGWGEAPDSYGNIAILELAKTWFINNLTAR